MDPNCIITIQNHPTFQQIVDGPGDPNATTTTSTTSTTSTSTSTTTSTTTSSTTSSTTTTSTTTTTPAPDLNSLYIIALTDEASPNYNDDDGDNAGNYWSSDVNSFVNAAQTYNFDSKFLAVFDIDCRNVDPNSVSDDKQIWPVNVTPSILPIPTGNIIRTDRPSKTGENVDTDQDKLAGHILDCINGVYTGTLGNRQERFTSLNWGGLDYIAANEPDAKIIFVIDDSGSMTYDLVYTAITNLATTEIEGRNGSNLTYEIYTSCANERWLNWASDVIENGGFLQECGDGECGSSWITSSSTCLREISISLESEGGSYTSSNAPFLFGDCSSLYYPYNQSYIVLTYQISETIAGIELLKESINLTLQCNGSQWNINIVADKYESAELEGQVVAQQTCTANWYNLQVPTLLADGLPYFNLSTATLPPPDDQFFQNYTEDPDMSCPLDFNITLSVVS